MPAKSKWTRASINLSFLPHSESGLAQYNFADIILFRSGSERADFAVRFQRHRLDTGMTGFGPAHSWFDYGSVPWSFFYAPTVVTQFSAEFPGPDRMMDAARLLKRIDNVQGDFPQDQLARWIRILPNLYDVDVEIIHWGLGKRLTDVELESLGIGSAQRWWEANRKATTEGEQ